MAETADDRALVAKAQRDPRQFTALYERNVDAVHAYIYRRVDNRADAEDITSLVFQKAFATLDRFEWRGVPFVAWLVRIAANELASRGRRASVMTVSIDNIDTPEGRIAHAKVRVGDTFVELGEHADAQGVKQRHFRQSVSVSTCPTSTSRTNARSRPARSGPGRPKTGRTVRVTRRSTTRSG
jgi:RNA polymerase sigma factor (sigma-70 family)